MIVGVSYTFVIRETRNVQFLIFDSLCALVHELFNIVSIYIVGTPHVSDASIFDMYHRVFYFGALFFPL